MGRSGIANIDGGSRGNPGPASWAFVVKDEKTGQVIERQAAMGSATNNVAEYTALVQVLTFALEADFTHLAIRSDSELLVRQMTGVYKVKNAELLPLYEDAKGKSKRLESFAITHIRREYNKRADELCNLALDAEEKSKGVVKPTKAAKASKSNQTPAEKDLRERCLPLIEFYAEDWRNGAPVKPFSELLMKELIALIEGRVEE